MKKLVVLLIFAMASTMLFAQKTDDRSPVTRKEKRKAEVEKQYQLNKSMLENKDFVLEADYLHDRYGHRVFVTSTINFVAIDSTEAVIQIGSNSRIGPNGVGGITAKGKISGWTFKENKKQKSFTASATVMTGIGIYELQFQIGPGNYATADLTGLSAGKLTFEGKLVPTSESSVFEGQSL